LPHHDIARLPNGNVLMLVWERKTAPDAIENGRQAKTIPQGHLLADCLIEIKPTGKTTGEIVWEWHAFDHLIQDHNKSKANHGTISAHPELIDINFGMELRSQKAAKEHFDKLRDIGYLGGPTGSGAGNPDWTHINSVAYNPDLDQIALSAHSFGEIWIIDHSTTKAQAAGHEGGRQGKGGDLLYRWGNPRAYGRGKKADQQLFSQHDAHWIPKGLPGAGRLLVFNNGCHRSDGEYSSVDEIAPPVNANGHYSLEDGAAFGPAKPVWTYSAANKTDFYSVIVSGAQRLANGNTLICSGVFGVISEVTPNHELVWRFKNPDSGSMLIGRSSPGKILSPATQESLHLTAAQRTSLEELQKEADVNLDRILTADQNRQIREMRADLERSGSGISLPSRLPRRGGAGVPPGPPGLPKTGPWLSLFRSYRYAPNYPGLAGRDLAPGKILEELLPK
jgi:hypothetical protein